MLTSRYNAMILECQLDGENVEIITRAYGNVQVCQELHCSYIIFVIFVLFAGAGNCYECFYCYFAKYVEQWHRKSNNGVHYGQFSVHVLIG